MRAFSIFALCLLAAGANALSVAEMRECVQSELTDRLKTMVDEVNERLDKVSGESGGAVAKARKHFKDSADEFKNALTQPLNEARAEYDACVAESTNVAGRAMCMVTYAKDLVTKVIPIASEKTINLVQNVNEIVNEFRSNRKAGFEDLSGKAREFGRGMIDALKTCFTK